MMLHGVWTLGLLTFAKALNLENFGCATPLEYTTAIGGFGLRVNSANASISGLSVGVQLDVGDQCSRTYTPSISIDKFTYNYTLQAGVLALVLPTMNPRDDNAGFYGTVEGTNLVFVQGRAGPSDSQFTLIPMCNTTGGHVVALGYGSQGGNAFCMQNGTVRVAGGGSCIDAMLAQVDGLVRLY